MVDTTCSSLQQLCQRKNVSPHKCCTAALLVSLGLSQRTRVSCAVWLVYEQVAIAALDTRAKELAVSLVQKIRKKFPNSSRTYRLTVRHLSF